MTTVGWCIIRFTTQLVASDVEKEQENIRSTALVEGALMTNVKSCLEAQGTFQ